MTDKSEILKALRKRYGNGVIMKLDDAPQLVEAVPTGSRVLDHALRVGGIPRGRITEIYGPDYSGKTTLAYHVMAEAQAMGGEVVYIDTEHSFEPSWAATCGVSLGELVISQPDYGEQALDIAEALVRSGDYAVIVIDSVAALVPKAELEGDMGQAHMGLQARLMSQALRKLAGAIRKSNTAVVFTNQLRTNIGTTYGNPEVTSGGKALKYYAAVRLEVRASHRKELAKMGVTRVTVKVRKNKVGPPYGEAVFDIVQDQGIDAWSDLLDWLVLTEQVEKRGSWFYLGEESIGQGAAQAKAWLRENWKEDMASGHRPNE